MLKINERSGNHLSLEVSGVLSKEEFLKVEPVVEEIIEREGNVNLLVSLIGFEGSTPSAALEELRFESRHRKDIERLAILTEKPSQRLLGRITGPILNVDVRYFFKWELNDARDWLKWPAKNV